MVSCQTVDDQELLTARDTSAGVSECPLVTLRDRFSSAREFVSPNMKLGVLARVLEGDTRVMSHVTILDGDQGLAILVAFNAIEVWADPVRHGDKSSDEVSR